MRRLATEIADENSVVVIEANSVQIRDHAGCLWYEVDPTDEISWAYVERAVRYLTLRGKLRQQKGAPHRVMLML